MDIKKIIFFFFLFSFFLQTSFSWYYEKDFNDGTLGEKAQGLDGFDSNAGRSYYTSDEVYEGGMAAELNILEGTEGFGNWGGSFDFPDLEKGDEVWFQVKTYFPSSFDFTASPYLKFLRLRTSNSQGGHEGYNDILFRPDIFTNEPYIGAKEGPTVELFNFGDSSDNINVDTWETFEWYVKLDDVSVDDGGTGVMRLWKNGELIGEATGIETLTNSGDTGNFFYLFSYWNSAPSTKAYESYTSSTSGFIEGELLEVNGELSVFTLLDIRSSNKLVISSRGTGSYLTIEEGDVLTGADSGATFDVSVIRMQYPTQDQHMYVDEIIFTNEQPQNQDSQGNYFIGVDEANNNYNTYWISKDGSNSNDCLSEQSSCLSIQKVLSLVEAGDTINIKEGVYIEDPQVGDYQPPLNSCRMIDSNLASLCIQSSGTESNPIVIQAAPGHEGKVIIDGEGTRGGFLIGSHDYIHIKNLKFVDNYYAAIRSWGQVQNEVPNEDSLSIGCLIEGNSIVSVTGAYGLNVAGIGAWGSKDWIIRNNYISNVSREQSGGASGIQAYGIIDALIENNEFYNVEYGIFWKDHFVKDEITREPYFESEIRNNIFASTQKGVYIGIRGTDSVEAGGNYIHHNIFYNHRDSGHGAISFEMTGAKDQSKNLRIEHNLIDGDGSASFGISGDAYSNVSIKGNIITGNQNSYAFTRYSSAGDKQVDLIYSNYNLFDESFNVLVDRYSSSGTTSLNSLSSWQAALADDFISLDIDNPDQQSILTSSNELYVNSANRDYSYLENSPAIGFMSDGTNAGPYQFGDEIIGLLPNHFQSSEDNDNSQPTEPNSDNFSCSDIYSLDDNLIFCDDFETGDLSSTNNGFRWRDSTGARVNSDNPFEGNNSLRFLFGGDLDLSSDAWSEQRFSLDQKYEELWVSYKMWVPENYFHRNPDGAANNKGLLMLWGDSYSGYSPTLSLHFQRKGTNGESYLYPAWRVNGGVAFNFFDPDDLTTDGPLSNAATGISIDDRGTWVDWVMHVKTSTIPVDTNDRQNGDGNGIIRVWKNGDIILNISNAHNYYGGSESDPGGLGDGWNAGYLLGWANSGFDEDTLIYLDNFLISTDSLMMFSGDGNNSINPDNSSEPETPATRGVGVFVDSTYSDSAYNKDNLIDDDLTTDWASVVSSNQHYIVWNFSSEVSLNSLELNWGFNEITNAYMSVSLLDISYWDGSAYVDLTSIEEDSNTSVSLANFNEISTNSLRFTLDSGNGNDYYNNILWVSEISYSLDDEEDQNPNPDDEDTGSGSSSGSSSGGGGSSSSSSSSSGSSGSGSQTQTRDPTPYEAPVCVSDIEYSKWSECLNGEQFRVVSDNNLCRKVETQERVCELGLDENELKALNAKELKLSKISDRRYQTTLSESYNEMIYTSSKLDDDKFILVDNATQDQYLGRLVEEEPGKYYYTLELVDANNLASLKEEGLAKKTLTEKVGSAFKNFRESRNFISIMVIFTLFGITTIIYFITRYVKRIHKTSSFEK